MFTQTPRRKQMLERIPSPFSIRSRHNLHTISMQQQQLQYRGSSPPRARLQGQRQDPQSPSHHRLSRLRPSCSRCPSLSPSLPSLAVLCALSALTPRIFMGFRRFVRRHCRTYVNNESTGTLAACSASTVVLPVQPGTLAARSASTVVLPVLLYWQCILDQGLALPIQYQNPLLPSHKSPTANEWECHCPQL